MDIVLGLKLLLGLLAALLLALTAAFGALFWQRWRAGPWPAWADQGHLLRFGAPVLPVLAVAAPVVAWWLVQDRKSTRLNSSHVKISYAVFCLKKKTPERQGISD